jgi:hypothetical protein
VTVASLARTCASSVLGRRTTNSLSNFTRRA